MAGYNPRAPVIVETSLDLQYTLPTSYVPAVLATPIDSKAPKDRPRYVSRYHDQGSVVRSYQVVQNKDWSAQPGHLVRSRQVIAPPGAQVGPKFLLPKEH